MVTDRQRRSIFTAAVHAGERAPSPDFTPVSTPIYNAVGYLYEEMQDLEDVFAGAKAGYVYARFGNPTNRALEVALTELEAGEEAVVFGSGMAAVHASLLAAGVKAGASVVAAQDLYGATYNLLARFFGDLGVETHFVDLTDLERTAEILEQVRPTALIMEGISNPLLKVADIPRVTTLAQAVGALVIVDNTFTTPYIYQPLADGVDYVVHSTTKYLAGHGDALGGAVIGAASRMDGVREVLKQVGGCLGPNEAYLTLRGLKTFPLRMRQQCANAYEVASWLASQKEVQRVYYPGLGAHPQHDLAQQLYKGRGYGGMIAFEIAAGDQSRVFRFFNALDLCLPATTLGDVYSLVLYPPHSSHRTMTSEERSRAGIGPGLVRMSVGIEEAADIINDLEQALAQITIS